jgi:uncharacterized hydantoinase/oxoprolinase family protein
VQWLGLDIGGAHVKLADGRGYATSYPFALWKHPQNLDQELRTLIAQAPPCDHLGVTMTGELADCFESKVDGVNFILEAVRKASDSRHTRVYLNNGMLVTPQVAATRPQQVAAANWSVCPEGIRIAHRCRFDDDGHHPAFQRRPDACGQQ